MDVQNALTKKTKANNDTDNNVKIESDQILYDSNSSLKNDEAYIMPAGEYKIIDGKIAFQPIVGKVKKYCWVETHQGHIFGHEYNYSYSFCITVPFITKSNSYSNIGGLLRIDLSQNPALITLANNNNGVLNFDEDIVLNNNIDEFKKNNEKIIIKAGSYFVNEDGAIYIRNFSITKN